MDLLEFVGYSSCGAVIFHDLLRVNCYKINKLTKFILLLLNGVAIKDMHMKNLQKIAHGFLFVLFSITTSGCFDSGAGGNAATPGAGGNENYSSDSNVTIHKF